MYSSLHEMLVKEFGDAPAQVKVDSQRLSGEGFVAYLIEHLTPSAAPSNGAAVSTVMELGSPAAAAREQRTELQHLIAFQGISLPGRPALVSRDFTVPGVPSADGLTGTQAGLPGGEANVLFTEGRCMLVVGDSRAAGNITAPVTAAVQSIYRRTHGRCP
jgi:hypothetical protein